MSTQLLADPAAHAVSGGSPDRLLDGRILVATDGNQSADGAVAFAADLLRRRPLDLSVLAVYEPAPSPVPTLDPSLAALTAAGGDEPIRREFHRAVERQLARIFVGISRPELRTEEGSPVRMIVDVCQSQGTDLILTGLREHGLIDRLVGDETALRVTRATDRPVFAVLPTLLLPPTRAVVGIDFSRGALRAAHAAAGMLATGGSLTLVHSRPFMDVSDASDDGIGLPYARGVGAALDGLRNIVAAAHPDITVTVERRDGDAATALLNFALAAKADFIAVGRHRRNAIAHAVLGSVATSLLRAAKLSVLVMPPRKDD